MPYGVCSKLEKVGEMYKVQADIGLRNARSLLRMIVTTSEVNRLCLHRVVCQTMHVRSVHLDIC
jgi:hypothetical protein